MEEKEFNLLIEKIEKAMGEKMDAKLKDAFKEMNPEVLETVVKNSEQLTKNIEAITKTNEKLTKDVSEALEEVNKLKEVNETKAESLTLKEAIKKGLKDGAEKLKALKGNRNAESVSFTTKAAADMLLSTHIVSSAQIPQADRESGITRIVRRQPFILQLVNVGTINSNLWEWVQQVNADGDAAMTAEGASKAQIDFDLALASAQVRKVTAYVKISKEMLDDVDLIESEINQELTEVIMLKIDAQLLSGDGTGQNLTGILENATAWSVTGFANTVPSANKSDVLKVAINQIMVNQFVPNYIVLHPSDVTSMELEKGTDGHYVLPPFRTADGTRISGVPVVANTGMTVGSFLVGDFTKSGVRFKEGLTFDVGYENDDFTKNFVTILAEARLVHRVKSNHYGAFVTGTFAAATPLLDPDVADA